MHQVLLLFLLNFHLYSHGIALGLFLKCTFTGATAKEQRQIILSVCLGYENQGRSLWSSFVATSGLQMNFINTGTISSTRGTKQHHFMTVSWLNPIQCSPFSSSFPGMLFPSLSDCQCCDEGSDVNEVRTKGQDYFMKYISYFCLYLPEDSFKNILWKIMMQQTWCSVTM